MTVLFSTSTEKFLEIRNPYSQPLHWSLVSVASPFVRNVSGSLISLFSNSFCCVDYKML